MSSLISREAAIDAIDKHIGKFDAIEAHYLDGLKDAMSLLKGLPSAQLKGCMSGEEKRMLTKDEAFAVAQFIDDNIFNAIRNDIEWDSFQALRSLIHAYEKCCEISGYVGLTDSARGEENE